MPEAHGVSIMSENMVKNEEDYPNQSTPNTSTGDENATANSNVNQSKREECEGTRAGNFSNVSILQDVNASSSQIEQHDNSGNEQRKEKDEKEVIFNIADNYFEAKGNKFQKQTSDIIISLEKGMYIILPVEYPNGGQN